MQLLLRTASGLPCTGSLLLTACCPLPAADHVLPICATVPPQGKLAGSVCKKNARRTNFAAAAEAQSAGRPDLKVGAVHWLFASRWSLQVRLGSATAGVGWLWGGASACTACHEGTICGQF